MELPFTHKPGRRERHLQRRHKNPLFAWPPQEEVAPEDLLAAQKADHEEMETFRESFVALVQQAIDLKSDAGSDTLLRIKEELELAYEQSFGLPEDLSREQGYIRQLITLVMKALRRNADTDPVARAELQDEENARAIHQQLLEQPLIADILPPDTPITADELAPSALDASAAEIEALVAILDPQQLASLVQQAVPVLDQWKAQGISIRTPVARLRQMTACLESLTSELAFIVGSGDKYAPRK